MRANRRIAVVDDDHSVRRALHRLLRSFDLDAVTYKSAQEFLDAIVDDMPACLVLDLQMPDMNGLELQQRLSDDGVKIPVIIITAYDEPAMLARCLFAGASSCIRKPLDDSVLLAAIHRAID